MAKDWTIADRYLYQAGPLPEDALDIKLREQEIEASRCAEHKRYQAKRKPSGGCEQCWIFYLKFRGLV